MKSELLSKDEPFQKARNRCIKKFIYYFKKGYQDQKYIDWELQYKRNAHLQFQEVLNRRTYINLLKEKEYEQIALFAVRIEAKTNLLFSFEKIALRDAIKSPGGAKTFAIGLYDYIYGEDSLQHRFERFVQVISSLPRKQTRVLTWPLLTVFGFIANPDEHMFLKPRVTQKAAEKYKFAFHYKSRPNWETYQSLFDFAKQIERDTKNYSQKITSICSHSFG